MTGAVPTSDDDGRVSADGLWIWNGQTWTPSATTDPARAQAAAPGWYPDPELRGSTRYWDGRAWTENRSALNGGPDPAASQLAERPARRSRSRWKAAVAVSAGLAALWAFVALPGAAEPDEAANEQPATPPAKALKVKYTEQITDITFVDPRTVQVQVRIVNEGKNVTEVRCAPSVSSADGSYRGSTWDTFGGWLDPGETMEFTALIPVKDEGAAWITTGKPNCTGEGKAIEGFYGAPVVRALEERGFTCDGRQGSAAFAYTCTKPGSGFEQTVTTRDFDDDDRDEIFGTVTPKTAKVLEALGLKKVQIASDGTRITMDDSEGRIPG